jgi:hypothetical protein
VTGIKKMCIKNVVQYNSIVALLLSTMDERYEENTQQVCGSAEFSVLVGYY